MMFNKTVHHTIFHLRLAKPVTSIMQASKAEQLLISNLASLKRKKRTFFRTLGNQMLDNTPGLLWAVKAFSDVLGG